jgi:hypothetical protein
MSIFIAIVVSVVFLLSIFITGLIATWLVEHFFDL